MSIDDLAPALLGVAKLFNEVNRIVNEDQTRIAVNVKGTKDGSFLAYLDVLVNPIKDVLSFLGSQEISGAVSLKEIIIGAVSFILFLGGYKKYKAKKIGKDRVRITVDGKSGTLEIPVKSIDLSKNVPVVESFLKVFAPVQKEGVDTATLASEQGLGKVSVVEQDIPYFQDRLTGTSEETVQQFKMKLTIISLAFRKTNKWRVSNGSVEFYVVVDDDEFVSRVEANRVPFRHDDVLDCIVEQSQKLQDGKLTAHHRIIRVLRHRPSETPQDLPFLDDQDSC